MYLLQSEVESLRSMMRPMQQVDGNQFASDEADTPAAEAAPQARRIEAPIASAISQVIMTRADLLMPCSAATL